MWLASCIYPWVQLDDECRRVFSICSSRRGIMARDKKNHREDLQLSHRWMNQRPHPSAAPKSSSPSAASSPSSQTQVDLIHPRHLNPPSKRDPSPRLRAPSDAGQPRISPSSPISPTSTARSAFLFPPPGCVYSFRVLLLLIFRGMDMRGRRGMCVSSVMGWSPCLGWVS